MSQDSVFSAGEGDAYFERNQQALDARVWSQDPVIQMMIRNALCPRTVLEVGCAAGHRLAYIRETFGASCTGIDASQQAIKYGQRRWLQLDLQCHNLAHGWFLVTGTQQLIIASFVLHWLPRDTLWWVALQMHRLLPDDGYIILADFAPDYPVKTPYHHKAGLWTWKLPDAHAEIFKATAAYTEIDRQVFNHDTYELGDAPSHQRGMVVLLRKGDFYHVEGI